MTDMSPASLVKQESLLAAERLFSPLPRMKNLFGPDHTAIMDCVHASAVRANGFSIDALYDRLIHWQRVITYLETILTTFSVHDVPSTIS